jgi:uncharacterized membrane protein (UPF0127 family)
MVTVIFQRRTDWTSSMRLIAAFIAFACLWAVMPQAHAQSLTPLTVETSSGSHRFMVEIADNNASRAQGLMYRRELAADRGMLFDFHQEQNVSFWMQNTYVSLDIIFVGTDGVVRRIEEKATPLSERMIDSGTPVQFVLEVPAGTSARLGIKRGSRVKHAIIKG